MKIIDLDIPTVEYDLSKIDRNITKAELKNILVNKPKVRWLYVKSDKRFYFFAVIPKWYAMSVEYYIEYRKNLWKAVEHAQNVLANRKFRKTFSKKA